MTVALSAKEIVAQLSAKFPGAVEEAGNSSALVKSNSLLTVAEYLKTGEGLKFDYLNYITAVDYYSYLEVVYQITSLEFNRSVVLRTRCYTRDNPTVPSVIGVWQGADFQARALS